MRKWAKGTRSGFTLIELSFAIAFISVLLITITLITREIVSIYRKGYAIKTVNQVGRDIIDDFQNSIMQSPPSAISSFCDDETYVTSNSKNNCKSNGGFYSVYQQIYAEIDVAYSENDSGASTGFHYLPTGGLFCSGKYTYIWNTGYLFNEDGVVYHFKNGATKESLRLKLDYRVTGLAPNNTPYKDGNFRLLKIEDGNRAICKNTFQNTNAYPAPETILTNPGNKGTHTITIPDELPSIPEEMLKDNDASLSFYDLVLFEPARATASDRLLFSGSFILGTATGGVDIMTSSNYCKTPSNFSADFSYCSINKFNFSIQASGNS